MSFLHRYSLELDRSLQSDRATGTSLELVGRLGKSLPRVPESRDVRDNQAGVLASIIALDPRI